jgi:hypothetical protein
MSGKRGFCLCISDFTSFFVTGGLEVFERIHVRQVQQNHDHEPPDCQKMRIERGGEYVAPTYIRRYEREPDPARNYREPMCSGQCQIRASERRLWPKFHQINHPHPFDQFQKQEN